MMRLQPHFLSLSAIVGLLAVMSSAAPAQTLPINGVYYVPSGSTLYTSVLTNASVDGVLLKINWSDFEPTEDNFIWGDINGAALQIANANVTRAGLGFPALKVEFDLIPGWRTPSWVYTDGASAFSWPWSQSYGPFHYCDGELQNTVGPTAPIPWDPIYEAKFATAIATLATRVASFPSPISMVKLTGVNTASDETFVPNLVNVTINPGGMPTCTSPNEVMGWSNAGYSQPNIQRAFEYFANQWATAFPQQDISAMFVKNGFLKDTPNSPVESALASDGSLPSTFVDQNNGWSSTSVGLSGLTNEVGYQEGAAMGPSFPMGVTNILSNLNLNPKPKFLEVTESDIMDTMDTACALQKAHDCLVNGNNCNEIC